MSLSPFKEKTETQREIMQRAGENLLATLLPKFKFSNFNFQQLKAEHLKKLPI